MILLFFRVRFKGEYGKTLLRREDEPGTLPFQADLFRDLEKGPGKRKGSGFRVQGSGFRV